MGAEFNFQGPGTARRPADVRCWIEHVARTGNPAVAGGLPTRLTSADDDLAFTPDAYIDYRALWKWVSEDRNGWKLPVYAHMLGNFFGPCRRRYRRRG